jgi:uncharacterized membrane protein (UPF0127 family)
MPASDRLPAAALALAFSAAAAAGQPCAPEVVDLRDGDSELRFRVEVADDAAERARGLMFRESMPRFSGMLFVYEQPQPVAFWMESTLIPLDMLFFDPAGVLTRVHPDARPLDRTPIPGGDGVRFVLEINGGLAAELGIAPGAELRHPAVDQAQAAWPCDEE